jgi:CRISPR-associated protein Csb2
MVLPGYDDKHKSKTEELIRRGIRQAGYSELLAKYAELDWRMVGYWPGTDLARRYEPPEYLRNFPRYHVRITWRDANGNQVPIRGPICIGGGRFIGLGLFAAVVE